MAPSSDFPLVLKQARKLPSHFRTLRGHIAGSMLSNSSSVFTKAVGGILFYLLINASQ